MKIDSINNGIVIDHITAGKGLTIFELLHLNELENSVAIIKNVPSSKSGKKDIIKIDANIEVDLDIIGYVDPGATVNIIKNGVVHGLNFFLETCFSSKGKTREVLHG